MPFQLSLERLTFLQGLSSEFLFPKFLSFLLQRSKMRKEDKEEKRKGKSHVSGEGRWCFILRHCKSNVCAVW